VSNIGLVNSDILCFMFYCVAVLIGRIRGLARLSVRLSVWSFSYELLTRREKT